MSPIWHLPSRHGAAVLLDDAQRGIDVVHLQRDHRRPDGLLSGQHAPADVAGLGRTLLARRARGHQVVGHLRHGLDLPIKHVTVEGAGPISVIKRDLEVYDSSAHI